ncbi:SusC/RagA family TonB-linked outer membrane protein [Terrimonas pollutisoli]|uniref:SusC/RagA family TonB-linked outer membrane protein n=1 Tax=Terrimonas pollutisoli TaxID=3034147 RepID=UPI0023EDB964|nr:SusC/RagA family TonB-linked outer membrane protein [Terrimonas sp. H1YJ31]
MKRLLYAFLLPFLLFSFSALAQEKVVTGKVTDSKDGSPVIGASVQPKGSKTGTSTGADGTFRIAVPAGINTLVISSAEFERQELDITDKTSIDVSLVAASAGLSEVVVIGYGTARKKDLTGSVASVQAKDFNKGTYTSPDQLIQGKAAGVLVINNTGQPGGSTTVRIRGSSSIRSGNQPLFVLDGVPLSGGSARPGGQGRNIGNDGGNPLNYINPNDIASIEILKDASATAIYGSRGANGVVIINTKRGKSGIPTVDVSASTGISNVLKKLEVLSAAEYRQALKDYSVTTGDFGGNVDAFDEISRTGLTQNYNVAVGGGTDNGRYRLSVGYLDQEGIIKTSELKKITANLTSSFKFLESKKLGLDINVLVTQTNEQIAPISAFVGFEGNLISQALQWNPTHPLIKPGTDSAWIQHGLGLTTVNPLATLDFFDDKAKVNTIIASISPSYKITRDLEYKFLYSVNRQVGNRKGQINRVINEPGVEGHGAAFVRNQEQTNTQITNTLNFNKQITSDFNLNALLGHEWLIFDSKGSGMFGQDFPNNGLDYYDIMHVSSQSSRILFNFDDPTTELQSYFARAIVNYKDKYLLTGTFRADGSTKFGENNKYGYFPSVGLAWNITKEDFLAGNSFFNNLKLRLGWGKTGNQEFPSGASLNRVSIGQYNPSRQEWGLEQVNYGNEDLKWETSATTNAGIDFTILDNRISGSIDYFYKKTTDVLFEQNLVYPAPQVGRIWINLDGYVLNKGVEITLNGTIMSRKDFNWNLGGNASFLKNTVKGLAGFYETGELRGQGFSNVRGQRLVANQPLNVWYLQKWEGLDKTTGKDILANGGAKFYSGSPNPKMLLGLFTDLTYKKFSAALNFNGTFGHYLYNNTAATVVGIGNLGTRNIAKDLLGGDVQESRANAASPSTRFLEKGNYVKLANASIGYRVGDIGKNIRNLYISLTGQNLFVITKYNGFDPEVNTDGGFGGIPSLGIEYVPYPSARSFQLGINLSL